MSSTDEPTNLEIHEVTIGVSLSSPMDESTNLEIHEITTRVSLSSSTTESIAPLNHRINTGKYEHPCQVEDLNPGDRFYHKETEPTDP